MPTYTPEQEQTTRDLLAKGQDLYQRANQEISAINSTALAPAPKFTLPDKAPTPSLAPALGGYFEQYAKDFGVVPAEQNKNNSLDALISSLANTPGETALTAQAYNQGGVDNLGLELKDLNNQLLGEQQALKNELSAIEKNTEGLTIGALQDRMNDAKTASLRRQSDIAVVQMAKQGQYDSAKAIADRAIAAQLERDRQRNEILQFVYGENKELFNKKEQRAFEVAQADRNRELDRKERDLKTISDLSLDALQNGAPAAIAAQMRSAKTVEDAYKIGGQYVGALDRAFKVAQINKIGYDNLLAQAEAADRAAGILTDKDIKNIDASPQGKQLQVASNLKLKMSSYQDLVDKYGFESVGQNKAVLQNAYTELQLAYKEAANLGVLNGPDLGLVEQAIRSATPGVIGNIGNIVSFGQGTRNLKANLEQAQTTLNAAAAQKAEELYARNPYYKDSAYVQSILLPFGEELVSQKDIQSMDAVISQP